MLGPIWNCEDWELKNQGEPTSAGPPWNDGCHLGFPSHCLVKSQGDERQCVCVGGGVHIHDQSATRGSHGGARGSGRRK